MEVTMFPSLHWLLESLKSDVQSWPNKAYENGRCDSESELK